MKKMAPLDYWSASLIVRYGKISDSSYPASHDGMGNGRELPQVVGRESPLTVNLAGGIRGKPANAKTAGVYGIIRDPVRSVRNDVNSKLKFGSLKRRSACRPVNVHSVSHRSAICPPTNLRNFAMHSSPFCARIRRVKRRDEKAQRAPNVTRIPGRTLTTRQTYANVQANAGVGGGFPIGGRTWGGPIYQKDGEPTLCRHPGSIRRAVAPNGKPSSFSSNGSPPPASGPFGRFRKYRIASRIKPVLRT